MRIVQIGLGVWGEKNSEILSQLGVLSGICELDTEKAKSFGEKYSVKNYDSVDKLCTSEEFDAACIDSSFPDVIELASNLLYDKKHVLVENSLTENSAELEKLREISQKKKVMFSCYYPKRFDPMVKELKKFKDSEQYGEIVSLELFRETSSSDKKLVFQYLLHEIDIVNQIFGETPIVVFARMFPNEEETKFANIMLGFPNNKSATILANDCSSKTTKELKMVYSQKTIMADLLAHKIKDSDEIMPVKDEISLQLENFIKSIEGEFEAEVKISEIINNVKIAEAALLSSKQGVPIYLDLK